MTPSEDVDIDAVPALATAVIFGHSSGLGRALSQRLLTENYRVLGIARTPWPVGSPNLLEFSADLSLQRDVLLAADFVRDQFPTFDVLVYSAGTLTAHDLSDLQYDALEYLYRVNLFAPMVIESRLLGLIGRNGADVVNITSSSILDYYPAFSEYSTAKSAFAKFTSDLRRQLQSSNARVTELCPSGFTSNMYRDMTGDKIDRDESKQISASDLAALIVDLLKLPKRMEIGRVYVNRK